VSVRVYSGMHSDRGRVPRGWVKWLPWIFLWLTIIGQVVWVLLPANGRQVLTILTVLTFFLASSCHAYIRRGLAWTSGFLAITLAFGFAIEAIGLATSLPFGTYSYAAALGPKVLGVPLLIPLAWSMISYPILLAVQRLSVTSFGVSLLGGWLLASWDLFLDPQMVGQGYWTWPQSSWELPGIPGIPLQNFLGWLLAGIVLMWLLDRLPRKLVSDEVPTVLLAWVFASNVIGNLVFFGRPGVALWGGICMGVIVVPWLWKSWSQPRW